jgi:hypothetical protein
MNAFTAIERLNLHAPIGLQFRDASDLSVVMSGLDVTLSAAPPLTAFVALTRNGHGIWASPRLPGIGAALLELPQSWAANQHEMIVSVQDPSGRYLPTQFTANLPQKGLLNWAAWVDHKTELLPLLPPDAKADYRPDYIPLFPTPNYASSGSRLIVRTQIFIKPNPVNPSEPAPASWALARVDVPDPDGGPDIAIALGVADAKGQLALSIPAPELPRGAPAVLGQFRWDATIRIYHNNLGQTLPPLEQIIAQHSGAAKRTLNSQALILGQSLILKTNPIPAESPSGLYLRTA